MLLMLLSIAREQNMLVANGDLSTDSKSALTEYVYMYVHTIL